VKPEGVYRTSEARLATMPAVFGKSYEVDFAACTAINNKNIQEVKAQLTVTEGLCYIPSASDCFLIFQYLIWV
jgi:hypothetical protein